MTRRAIRFGGIWLIAACATISSRMVSTACVRRWAAIVGEVAHGYELTLDDYRDDMDVRDIIAGVLPLATGTQRQAVEKQLADADRRLRDVTTVSSSLWGDSDADGAAAERWW